MDDTNPYLKSNERPYVKITVIAEGDGKRTTTVFEKTIDGHWEAEYESPSFEEFGLLRSHSQPVLQSMELSFQPLPNADGLMYTTTEEEIDG